MAELRSIDVNSLTSTSITPEQSEVKRGPARVLDELVSRPLADIADEVSRLREEKAALKDAKAQLEGDLRVLVPELNELRMKWKDLRGALKFFLTQTGYVQSPPRGPIDIGSLPHEILLRIIRASRVPRYQHDPSVCQGPRSPWMCELRFRKGLILVCKNWSGPATEALYEDVVLRRMGQIPALATALTTSWNAAVAIDQRNLADCVKSIRIDSCGVLPEYADEIHDALRTILERCTSLGVFEVHVDAALPTTVDQSGGTDVFFPVWLLENDTYPELQRAVRGRLTTLQVLDLSAPLSGAHVLRHLHQALLQCASTLETLKLGPYTDSADEEYDMSTLPLLSLPRLQELYVHTARNKLYYDLLCAMWNMPTLQRLTTLGDGSVPYRLLSQHGSHLRYLHLFPRNRSLPDITGIERVPDFCPALEHLVVAARSYKTQPFIPALKSDTLCYLDIWTCHEYSCRRWKKVLEAPPESALPALRSVRRLSDLRVDLPRICHPATELADGERVLYSVPNATYLQTRTHVMSDLQHLCMRHLSPKVNAGIESGHIRRPCWIAESFANAGELNQPTVLPAVPSSSVASDEEYESDGGDRSECDVGLDNESDGSDYKPKDDGSDDESDVSDEWCSEGVSDA